jgi:predicted amidohydrolase
MITTDMKRFRLKKSGDCSLRFIILISFAVASLSFTADRKTCIAENSRNGDEPLKRLRIAGVKMAVSDDINANVEAIKKAIDYATEEKADILLTPEGSLSGYTANFDKEAAKKALEGIVSYASHAKMGLALGTCFYEDDNKCYNEIRFYDAEGNLLGFHSKILRCGDMEDCTKGEINDFYTTPLRTFEFKGIIIGGLICNDLWANPMCTTLPDTHLSQQLSGMGARIIFHAVNGGRSESEWSNIYWDYHLTNLLIRAMSGKVWIVTADNSNPLNLRSSAPSGVINPEGKWVCETEAKGVQYFAYTIEIMP